MTRIQVVRTSSHHDSSEHWPCLEETTESCCFQLDIAPRIGSFEVWELLLLCSLLEETLRLYLQELQFEKGVVTRKPTETDKNIFGLFLAVMMDEPSGREGHE